METFLRISTEQLKDRLEQKHDFTLIDVLPREFYDEGHIPGAKQACVYEVTFTSQVHAIVPERQNDIVVYASSRRSRAAVAAAVKLTAAGYTNVYAYEGGTAEWQQAGCTLEGAKTSAEHLEPQIGTYFVDSRKSSLEWIGRNITGAHHGTIKVSEGFIQVVGGEAAHAAFTIDMESITNEDIRDEKLSQMLVGHLKSEDFFDVARHPTASFEVTHLDFIPGASPGSANCNVRGVLSMRGVANPIAFSAIIEKMPDGAVTAEIDRTRWNIIYGSGKFFEKLGKHLVYDDITLHLKLIAR